jgi:hypothetical protein
MNKKSFIFKKIPLLRTRFPNFLMQKYRMCRCREFIKKIKDLEKKVIFYEFQRI